MIPFDFVYCRPDTLEEAHETFIGLQAEEKNPVYYGGGSEIITLSRAGSIRPGAVIDIKSIPECTLLSTDQKGVHLGAACTLNQIKESKLYPLLTLACGRIADHTNQCRITLGGNICGTIMYRETCLPLLVSDAEVTLFSGEGLRRVPFQDVFSGRIQLRPDEFIVQLHVPPWAPEAPHYHVKRTRNEKIDYPLVSMSALRVNNLLRVAFSGLCTHPFRSLPMEAVLNDSSLSNPQRVERSAQMLPEPTYSDVEGSGEYRLFVFKNMLEALLEEVENDQI